MADLERPSPDPNPMDDPAPSTTPLPQNSRMGDPATNPPTEEHPFDPVPEHLRPTPSRITYWTVAVIALFFVVGALFMLGEFINGPNPTTATNPPPAKQSTSSANNG